MRHRGHTDFEAYARTLRRVFWAEFLDRQLGHEPLQARMDDPIDREPALAVYPLPPKGQPPSR